ncbi:MAG: putative sugar O-methyltransferase [Deltaproteobacteria bacterium]|nr:putative sugar O-methyltransferase [Deltaproteobacteria bacterium]
MYEFYFSTDFINRFQEFLSSKEYKNIPNYSKTEYWEYHADRIEIQTCSNKVTISGKSEFYIPQRIGMKSKVKDRITKSISNPSKLISFIKRKISIQDSQIKLLNYFDAFERVMNNDPIADPVLSPFRINFRNLKGKTGIISSISEMREKYFANHKYELTPSMVRSYYYYNIFRGYTNLMNVRKVLEIGAGNGNLSSLIYSSLENCTIVIVDLPEALANSIIFISDLFPDAKILMPHEDKTNDFDYYDFVFFTPKQIGIIEDNSIDLAINISSFQEMTHRQIGEYFELIQRCCKNNSYFFSSNRVEKIPCAGDCWEKETSEPANRFSEYPWNPANEVIIYETCRLARLVQLDNVFNRLELVRK